MKAIRISKYGGSDVLEILSNASKPSSGKGQVLVEVYAASINPVDWKLRAGYLKDWMPLQFPATLGGDFSGVVTQVGDGASEFKLGDELYGSAFVLTGGSGSFAEFAAVNSANAAYKPASVNFEEAAALPLAGASAVQALEEHIKLQTGQKILIHGGAGGIGSIAIQLAKSHGAYVATTVSSDDVEYVGKLGADKIIEYKKEKFEEVIKDYDVVFDTAGGAVVDASFRVLKKGGVLLSMLGQPDQKRAQEFGVIAMGQGTNTDAKNLKRLSQLIDRGVIKAQIDKVFTLDQIKDAFDYQEKNSPRGKIVIRCKT